MSSAYDLLYAPIVAKTDLVVPYSWLKVLQNIRSYSYKWANSTIAGGALRDLDLKRSIKDVDIFVPFAGDVMHDCLYDALGPLGILDIDEIEHTSNAASGGCPANHYIFDYDGWQFEISQRFEKLKSQRQILDTFDLGICMICLDGDKVYRSPAYEEDAKHHNITIIRETGGNEMAHAKRLLHKYAGWTIVPLNGGRP